MKDWKKLQDGAGVSCCCQARRCEVAALGRRLLRGVLLLHGRVRSNQGARPSINHLGQLVLYITLSTVVSLLQFVCRVSQGTRQFFILKA